MLPNIKPVPHLPLINTFDRRLSKTREEIALPMRYLLAKDATSASTSF